MTTDIHPFLRSWLCRKERCDMHHVTVYVCKGAICGRTIDKDYAELNENGHPRIDGYIPYEDPGDTWSGFKEVEK